MLPRDLAQRIIGYLDQMETACHTLDVVQVVVEHYADRDVVTEALGMPDEGGEDG